MCPSSRNTTSSDLSGIRSTLAEEGAFIRSEHFAGAGGSEIVQRRTALIDRTLKDLCGLHLPAASLPTIVAIGGYGRGELNPHSDIDIMLLCRDEQQRERSSPLLYSLWDAGLDIGYSVRTVPECIELGRGDARIRTSLLESRLIVGDGSLYASYRTRMHAEVFNRKIDQFIADKIAERAASRQKYGGSLYLREPNIKESRGGLRDFHLARWIAMTRFRVASFDALIPLGIISPAELALFRRARNFLWRVRNEVHYSSGRKNDQLTYDLQELAARDFHFRDSLHLMAVERFMKTYFLHARNVQQFARLITDRSLPQPKQPWFGRPRALGPFTVMGKTLLPPRADEVSPIGPEQLMEALDAAHSRGLILSEGLRQRIQSSRIDDDARASPALARPFLAILDRLEGLADTLTLMRDLKVLGRYLPEFRVIQGLARHDYFHLYTVDEHILTAVRNLEELWMGRIPALATLSSAIRGLTKRWPLTLAVLLHDLGKHYRTGHEHRGREIAGKVLDRMGISGDERQRIILLVEHHLLMSDLSQRRELSDQKVIAAFARTIGHRENLAMLYLLTYADMAAVSPAAWTAWKATLLQDLYLRTLEHMEHPEIALDEDERLRTVTARLLEEGREQFPPETVQAFLRAMPRHYLLSTAPMRLLEHLAWVQSLPQERLVIRHRDLPDRGCTELTVCAYDAYGMFYRTAGTIAAQGLSIVRAKVYTARNGIMMDTFEITGADGSMVPYPEVWETVTAELRVSLLTGRRPPEARISSYERPRPGAVPVDISFDNDASDALTIIDVVTRDRVGLLYRITRALYDMNLNITSAKITTEGIRAIDSFYVSDLLGAKIVDPDRLEKIRTALRSALEIESVPARRTER